MNQHTNKLKRRFNIIDIVILLALLAIVTFAANYIANDMFSKELVTVEYYLRIHGVSERDAAKLSVNDAVSANTSGTTLGKIREITVTDAKEAVFNSETGRYVYAPVPGKKTVYLRVSAVCTYKDHSYRIGDYVISAGTSPDILLPFSCDAVEIVSVRAAEAAAPLADSGENALIPNAESNGEAAMNQ